MIHSNGNRNTGNTGVDQEPARPAAIDGNNASVFGEPTAKSQDVATRAKLRASNQIKQNRFVLIAGGAIVAALLIFVFTSVPRRSVSQKSNGAAPANSSAVNHDDAASLGDKSLFPITDSARPPAKESQEGFLNERDMQRTVTQQHRNANEVEGGLANQPSTLGSVPPFGEQSWQVPAYQPGANVSNPPESLDLGKPEREAMEKSSLVYVRNISAGSGKLSNVQDLGSPTLDVGLGLATGTRLRARLESAANSAVRTPVMAVIEYNYERNGEIVVPAGTRVIGQMQDADRSGYVRIEFDSMMMPDGTAVPMQAVATDLEMRPLKGKVEGKNTGKNVLVRSMSGVGQVGAMLVGRGNLNQPLSESDLIRERVGSNIGEAGDEQISSMAVTQHIVVTLPANIPIYVVLEKTLKPAASSSSLRSARADNPGSVEELRQLLQLQRELNQPRAATQ